MGIYRRVNLRLLVQVVDLFCTLRPSASRVGLGLGLNRTRPDWVGWLGFGPVSDQLFGSDLMFQVISWASWSCWLVRS